MEDIKIRKPNYPFKIIAQSELCKTRQKFDKKKFKMLVNGKSALPYSEIYGPTYLYETKKIPPREKYFNDLNYSELSLADYKNIQKL